MASSSCTSIKQGAKSIRWVVGTFPESREYSAIPTNWLLKTIVNDRTFFKCKWPPQNVYVTSDIIKNAVDPSPDWPIYNLRLANNGKEYSNFNKAWHEKVQINSGSSSEFETPKRRKLQTNLFENFIEETDSSEDGYCISVPHKKSTPKMTSNVEERYVNMTNEIGNITIPQNQSNEHFEVEHYIPSIMTASTSTITSNLMENSYENPISNVESYINSEIENTTMLHKIQSNDNSNFVNESNPTDIVDLNKKTLQSDTFDNLVKGQHNLQMLMLERILSKVETIEKYLKNKDALYLNHGVILDDAFLINFPMNDPLQFLMIENLIMNHSDFTEKLEYFIKTVGGVDPKDHVKRILGKLFKDEYAIKCTWTGRGKDIVTKIGDSSIIKTVKKIIKACSNKLITDSEFEKFVSDWFRYANSRKNRAQHN